MAAIRSIDKQRYNLTYRAKVKGLKVIGRKKWILIYFDEITDLIKSPEALALIRDHGFLVKQNKQLKLNLKFQHNGHK